MRGGQARSAAHDLSYELLVIHVPLGVLLVDEQVLHFVIGELLAERGEQVSQLGRRDVAAGVFVEVAQPLDEVVGGVAGTGFRDRMVDGEEDLERNSLVCLELVRGFFHLRFGRILSQGAQALADLNSILIGAN